MTSCSIPGERVRSEGRTFACKMIPLCSLVASGGLLASAGAGVLLASPAGFPSLLGLGPSRVGRLIVHSRSFLIARSRAHGNVVAEVWAFASWLRWVRW